MSNQPSCTNNSSLPLLATGVINLNPLDTYNSGANKDFYKDLAIANFNSIDVLGYAFALAGFQVSSLQKYYALSVDIV
jgi:hypothetical protein